VTASNGDRTASGNAKWRFEGRVVVVTDPASARGAAQVRAFEDAGAAVYAFEMTGEASVEALARRIEEEKGRLDVLVMNDPAAATDALVDVEVEEWQRLIASGPTAAFLAAKHLAPLMFPRDYGKIVITTGPESSFGIAGRAHVGASRAALLGLARDLAIEFAEHHVNVNVAAAAAAVDESGDPDAVRALTHAVLWLSSDASRYVTASLVRADAELSAGPIAPASIV
jgi:NAD(P)-dependent dehydrogenase (short-subunit alcohol dehydrogenase family)